MDRQTAKRICRLSLTVMLLFTALCCIVACVLIRRSGSFTPEKVSAALRLLAIPVGLTGLLVLTGFFLEDGTPDPTPAETPTRETPVPFLPWIRLCFGILVLGLTIYGLLSGGTADVLAKAANICSECIGLE